MARHRPADAGARAKKKLIAAVAALLEPDAFADETAPDGGAGWVIGEEEFAENPARGLTAEHHHVVALWQAWRGGDLGTGPLPDPGGSNDQAAWLFDAFAILERTWAALRPKPDPPRGE